jgi:NAD(P)-dependent dehydrogenase (short-subunit alcohol dehydrogenase family)
MSADAWEYADIGDLSGVRALVTGVTSGLGAAVVQALAEHGAEVVMAARDGRKLAAAVDELGDRVEDPLVRPLLLDLADQSSVRRAAAEAATYGPVHLLVNNAGVMATPHGRSTASSCRWRRTSSGTSP